MYPDVDTGGGCAGIQRALGGLQTWFTDANYAGGDPWDKLPLPYTIRRWPRY